jgi:hypothetical protein
VALCVFCGQKIWKQAAAAAAAAAAINCVQLNARNYYFCFGTGA